MKKAIVIVSFLSVALLGLMGCSSGEATDAKERIKLGMSVEEAVESLIAEGIEPYSCTWRATDKPKASIHTRNCKLPDKSFFKRADVLDGFELLVVYAGFWSRSDFIIYFNDEIKVKRLSEVRARD